MHPRSRHHGRVPDEDGLDRHAPREGRGRRGREAAADRSDANAPASGADEARRERHERGERHERHGRRGERGDGPRSPRRLAHGDLRLLLLGLLEAQPRHGYELIQLIGEMFLGQYAPSAGAVYPALAQLQDDGLVVSSEDGARRLHALTDAGRAFAQTHAEALDHARLRTERSARSLVKTGLPAPVRSGMSGVKRALLAHHGHWTPESGEAIARILQQAAAQIAQVPRGD
ncbi:PadR family transcriptional regulator [Pseudoxanthomonas winnipegensis]|uniref:PadR family transcriptional regulator n=1 Tax=Pseudoxanthomonas winnipegensis TaxID=2480810 RepID=UPI003F8765D7